MNALTQYFHTFSSSYTIKNCARVKINFEISTDLHIFNRNYEKVCLLMPFVCLSVIWQMENEMFAEMLNDLQYK
jgi:hypothetical protein